MNKNIIDVLDSIVWYNGIGDILLKLKEDIINSEGEIYSKLKDDLKYKYDEFSNDQFEIFWMMLVLMYGDYGTSPRSGWLNMENKNEIISFIDQITKTTKEDFLNEEVEILEENESIIQEIHLEDMYNHSEIKVIDIELQNKINEIIDYINKKESK